MAGWNGQRWFASDWGAVAWFGPTTSAEISGSASFGITAQGDLSARALEQLPLPVFYRRVTKPVLLRAVSRSRSSASADLSAVVLLSAESRSKSSARANCTQVFSVNRARRIAAVMLFDLAA